MVQILSNINLNCFGQWNLSRKWMIWIQNLLSEEICHRVLWVHKSSHEPGWKTIAYALHLSLAHQIALWGCWSRCIFGAKAALKPESNYEGENNALRTWIWLKLLNNFKIVARWDIYSKWHFKLLNLSFKFFSSNIITFCHYYYCFLVSVLCKTKKIF